MLTFPKEYSHQQWDALLSKTVDQIKSLSALKGGEYAHGGDRLDNFRRAASDVQVPMEVVWRIYAGKHWDSLTTFIRDIQTGFARPYSEPISGRVDDLIVYLLLFKAMLEERDLAAEIDKQESR